MKTKGPIIHRSRLFGGVATAEEVHAQLGFGARCTLCGGAPVIQVRLFVHYKDFVEKSPQLAAMTAVLADPNNPHIPVVDTKFGPMVKVSTTTACRAHQKDLERTAAKAPSWCLAEIDRGPGADKPVVQVA